MQWSAGSKGRGRRASTAWPGTCATPRPCPVDLESRRAGALGSAARGSARPARHLHRDPGKVVDGETTSPARWTSRSSPWTWPPSRPRTVRPYWLSARGGRPAARRPRRPKVADETEKRLEHLSKALRDTPGADQDLLAELEHRTISTRCCSSCAATAARPNATSHFDLHLLSNRQVVGGQWHVTSAPTKTQEDNYASPPRPSAWLDQLRALVQERLAAVEKQWRRWRPVDAGAFPGVAEEAQYALNNRKKPKTIDLPVHLIVGYRQSSRDDLLIL